MRFAHIADTHLGIRQYNLDEREEDFYNAFHEAVGKIIESKCDFVVHSGDLFDEPRPPVRAMVEARDAIDRLLDAGIPVYAIAGNHDILMRKGALPPHAIYKKLEMLTPRKPKREFEGMLICGLPYHSKMHAGALRDSLQELGKEARNYDKSILLLHQGIDKYFGLEYELKIGDIPGGFEYYALGHIHKRMEDDFGKGKLVYPGSTEIWRLDELKDFEKNGKGFVIVDTRDFEPARVDLAGTRKFLSLEIGSAEDFDFEGVRRQVGDARPVISVEIGPGLEYADIYSKLKGLEGDALRLAVKKSTVVKKREEFSPKTVDIRDIIGEVMKDYTPAEKSLAVELFGLLKERKVDEAKNVSQGFFDSWGADRKRVKSAKPAADENLQSSMEAFK